MHFKEGVGFQPGFSWRSRSQHSPSCWYSTPSPAPVRDDVLPAQSLRPEGLLCPPGHLMLAAEVPGLGTHCATAETAQVQSLGSVGNSAWVGLLVMHPGVDVRTETLLMTSGAVSPIRGGSPVVREKEDITRRHRETESLPDRGGGDVPSPHICGQRNETHCPRTQDSAQTRPQPPLGQCLK